MAYQRTTWAAGDAITSAKLNNIESGIVGLETEIGNVQTVVDVAEPAEIVAYLNAHTEAQTNSQTVASE